MLRKIIVCAALVCVASARAFGQESDASNPAQPASVRDAGAEAARLLKSADNKERAWGAYLVGLHGLKGQTPSLVSMLEDESLGSGGPEESLARQAALDALIRLDAEVSAETLLPLYQSSPDEVVILLARSPERNSQALLQLFTDDAPTARWLAVGNLLAASRAQGFAARLLGGLKIQAYVSVYDREGAHDVASGYGGGCGCGEGGARDESLPPVGYYHLTADARRGVTVVAAGRHNVYYKRTPWARYCDFGCSHVVDFDSARVEYVADMLRTSEEELGLDASPFREVVCKDERGCLRALAGVREEIRRAHASAVARLLADGLLDAAEAAELKPDITLNLTDYREKKTFPLPDKLRGAKVIIEESEPESPASDGELPAPEAAEPAP